MINKHKSNKIKENSNTVRHLNNGTDHRHSKSCCDQSNPACRTIRTASDIRPAIIIDDNTVFIIATIRLGAVPPYIPQSVYTGAVPLNTWRNNNVVITSKRRHFDVITTSLLRNVSAGVPSVHTKVSSWTSSLRPIHGYDKSFAAATINTRTGMKT